MIIQEVRLSDLKQMVKIENENFTKPWTYKTLYYEVLVNNNSFFYGVFIDEVLVGYLGFWKGYDDIDVINVAVSNDYKQQGIATILFHYLERLAQDLKAKSISLEVRVSNLAAINLYKKLGFIKLRLIKNYYADSGDDAYFMQKSLKSKDK